MHNRMTEIIFSRQDEQILNHGCKRNLRIHCKALAFSAIA